MCVNSSVYGISNQHADKLFRQDVKYDKEKPKLFIQITGMMRFTSNHEIRCLHLERNDIEENNCVHIMC